jgi:hypothetical protein
MIVRYVCFVCTVALVAAVPIRSRADVTVTQHLATGGFGPLALGAMDGTTETAIAGSRARIASDMHFKAAFLRLVTGHTGESLQLIRLDEDLVDEVDARKKRYSETTFEEYRAAMKKASDDIEAAQRQQSAGTPTMDDSTCEWQPAETTVRRSGERMQIAGFEGEHVAVRRTQACVDKASGQRCNFTFAIEEWLATEIPGLREQSEFWKAYAKRLSGGDAMTQQGTQALNTIFSRYKDSWGDMMAKTAALKGYPLKSVLSMHVGGPGCESGQPAGASSATNPPAALIGLLGKLSKHSESTPASADGVELFNMTTETMAITTTPIPPERLQVPPDYKLSKTRI